MEHSLFCCFILVFCWRSSVVVCWCFSLVVYGILLMCFPDSDLVIIPQNMWGVLPWWYAAVFSWCTDVMFLPVLLLDGQFMFFLLFWFSLGIKSIFFCDSLWHYQEHCHDSASVVADDGASWKWTLLFFTCCVVTNQNFVVVYMLHHALKICLSWLFVTDSCSIIER